MPSTRLLSSSRPAEVGRRFDVPAPSHPHQPTVSPPATVLPAPAADSLASALLLAARAVAAVRAGRSLADAAGVWRDALPGARANASEITFGALRQYACGEFLLARLLARPLPDAHIEALLLAALYRLRSTPQAAHTIVDQAVLAAGTIAKGSFRALVNAVLRNSLRRRSELDAALATDDQATYQHPQWWLKRLQRAYPEHWQQIVNVGNSQPPMTLRVNRRRTQRAAYANRLLAESLPTRVVGADALLLARAVPIALLPGFADGLVSVQDAGAQRAAEILAPRDGERVLDACAAPGGKAAHLLETADVDLLALDIDPARCASIEQNCQRLGLSATIRTADCRRPQSWWDQRPFDAILADLPCSASGVVRRHPDIKYLRRDSDIRRFALQQAEMLDRLWPLLAPAGRLLYATCSVFPAENGEQIDAFLFRQRTACRIAEETLLPNDEHDGFYYALLRKTP